MRYVAEGTVLSHVSVAAVLDLPLWELATDKVTATRHRPEHGHQRTAHTITYSAPLTGAVTVVDGMPVTTPARTAVDLAREYLLDPAVCVAGSALHLGVATRWDIAGHVESAAGHRGVGGLPAPAENPELFDDEGFFLARPDLYWREWKLLGEYDTLGKYTRGGVDQASATVAVGTEKERENRILGEGYALVRWTWQESGRPGIVVQRIRSALLRQESAGLGPADGRPAR